MQDTNVSTSLKASAETLAKVSATCVDAVQNAAEALAQSLKNGGTVYFCGNGGSAGDAQHLAAELAGRFKIERPPLSGIALTTNTSAMTAIGNDYGYEFIFSRQLEGLAKKGDVLVAITTSGTSKNIVAAVSAAKKLEMITIGMTGEKGVLFAQTCDIALVTPSEDTPHIQEGHIAMGHAMCEALDRILYPTI